MTAFCLGLFSKIVRRLRAFRVRPLKSLDKAVSEIVKQYRSKGIELGMLFSCFQGAKHFSIAPFGMAVFNPFGGDAQSSDDTLGVYRNQGVIGFPLEGSVQVSDTINYQLGSKFHKAHASNSGPARARRQPQTVLEPRFKRQNIIILTLLALTSPLYAQNGFIGDLYQQTAAAVSAPFNNSNPKYNSWVVMYSYVGSGNFSVELDCAQDATTPGGTPTPSTFSACTNTVTGSNPSTQALGNFGYITFVGYRPWLETKINSISSGSITVVAYGYLASAPDSGGGGGGGGCVGTASTPCIVAGPNAPGTASTNNPVQVAGNDGTDVRAIATDTSGRTQAVGGAAVGSPEAGAPVPAGKLDNAGNIITPVYCNSQAAINLSAVTGENQIIALSGTKAIQVCNIAVGMSVAATVAITAGTGTNCAGATVTLWGPYPSNTTGFTEDWTGVLLVPAGDAVCLNFGATVTAGGGVSYAQF